MSGHEISFSLVQQGLREISEK